MPIVPGAAGRAREPRSGGRGAGWRAPGYLAVVVGCVCLFASALLVDDDHPAAPIPLAVIAAAVVCFGVAVVQLRRAKARAPRTPSPATAVPHAEPRAEPAIFQSGVPVGATVLDAAASTMWGLPAFVFTVCVIVLGSLFLGGMPSDTQTLVVAGITGAGAVASLIWLLRWRHLPLATLVVDRTAIAVMPPGPRPQPHTVIVRRPDSRLRIVTHTHATGASAVSVGVNVLYDEAVGEPQIAIANFCRAESGVDRVTDACLDQGWVFADPKMNRHSVPGRVKRSVKIGIAISLVVTTVLGYVGGGLLLAGLCAKPVMATIVSCEGDTCKVTWLEVAPDTGRPRVVHGTVDDLTQHEEGKQAAIVVARGHGFTRSDASTLGYVALLFALLCLAIASGFGRSAWQTRRAGAARRARSNPTSAA